MSVIRISPGHTRLRYVQIVKISPRDYELVIACNERRFCASSTPGAYTHPYLSDARGTSAPSMTMQPLHSDLGRGDLCVSPLWAQTRLPFARFGRTCYTERADSSAKAAEAVCLTGFIPCQMNPLHQRGGRLTGISPLVHPFNALRLLPSCVGRLAAR